MNTDQDSNNVDLTAFFDVFREGISIFKHSGQKVPGANFEDCRVIKGKKKKAGKIFFSFLDKREREVTVTIELTELFHDPKEYCEHLRHHINEAMNRAAGMSTTIIVPKRNTIARIVH